METVAAQGDEALEVLRKWLSHYEGLAAEGHMGNHIHTFDDHATRAQLSALVPKLVDPALTAAANRLIKALDPWTPNASGLPPMEMVPRLAEHRGMVEAAVENVRSFHRDA